MRQLLSVVTASALMACSSLDYGSEHLLPATLEFSSADTVVFFVPDSVQRDTPFEISVLAYGGGCVTKGPTDLIAVDDTLRELRPYEIIRTGRDLVCTLELRTFTHSATLSLSLPGDVLVRAIGRDRVGEPMSRTKVVVVR